MFQTTNQSPYICWFWWLNPLVIVILPLKSTTNSTILGAPLTSSHSSQQGPMLSVREGWIGWICFLRCQFGVVMRYTQKGPNKWLPLNDLCTCKNAYIYICVYMCTYTNIIKYMCINWNSNVHTCSNKTYQFNPVYILHKICYI